MSNQQNRETNMKFFLPKGEKSTVSETLDVCIEDFLEKLEDATANARNGYRCEVIELPEVVMGYLGFKGSIAVVKSSDVNLSVEAYNEPRVGNRYWCISENNVCKVKVVCGNLSFEKNFVNTNNINEKLKSVKELKEAMIASGNHKLDIKITFTMGEDKWIVKRKKPRLDPETVDLPCNIFEEEEFKDFTLESVEGSKFPCHRIVLGAQSPVLKRMIIAPMKEKTNLTVRLKYKADIVEKFVKYFYKKDIEEEKEENLGCYMELAEQYDIPHMKKQVEELAISKMSVENMVDMLLLADLYSAETLRKAAEGFILSNKRKVRESLAEMEKLEKSQLMKIMDILSS